MDSVILKALIDFEGRIDYGFTNREFLLQSLTHPIKDPVKNYEPLEFLGDCIFNAAVAIIVFEKVRTSDEGLLSRFKGYIVSKQFVAQIIEQLDITTPFRIINGEEGIITQRTLCDVFEAILGAIYLDSSFDTVNSLVRRLINPRFPSTSEVIKSDPKSLIQEWCQSQGLGVPVYNLVSREGPEHNTTFTVQLCLPSGEEFEGKGPSKKVAERNAAFQAVKYLGL